MVTRCASSLPTAQALPRPIILAPYTCHDRPTSEAQRKTRRGRGHEPPPRTRACPSSLRATTDARASSTGPEAPAAAEPVTPPAGQAGTISYELLTHLHKRLPRVYLQGGAVVAVTSLLGAEDG